MSANSLPLQLSIHSQPCQAEARNVVTGQAAFYDFRRPGIFNRGRAQAVKTENRLIVAVVNREEGFRRAQIVALAGVTAQEFIQRVLSAVGLKRPGRLAYRLARGAMLFEQITYQDVLQRNLKVMDSTAISLCMDNGMPIVVFNMGEYGNIKRVVLGDRVGSKVTTG